MNRLLELASKLTRAEVKKVEDFAEALITESEAKSAAQEPLKYVNVDAILGLCKGMGGDMSDKELIRESWDHLMKKYD